MAAVRPQGSSLRKGAAKTRSRDVSRIQDHDEGKFEIESKISERKNRILDALETHYHKNEIGRLLFSEPSSRRRTRSMETVGRTFVVVLILESCGSSSGTEVSSVFIADEGRCQVLSVAKKITDVNGTTMFNPDVTEYIFTMNDDGTELSYRE